MQENWLELAGAFSDKEDSVLATIIETQGATYQKVGTMMLVNALGECSGLLSGGCLEADIALHSQEVLLGGVSKVLHYDLTGESDLLWGLGGGCEGEINILLQPLTQSNNHLGFTELLAHVLNGKRGMYYQTIDPTGKPFGRFMSASEALNHKIHDAELLDSSRHIKSERLISIPVYPPISILVCGAGPDAVPVIQLALQLGWKVSLWDHRKAALSKPSFKHVDDRRKVRAEHIMADELDVFDAMVVMTHNLESDQHYLQKAIASNIPYTGLLGPAGRRDKLLNNLAIEYAEISSRVFGPIGLDLGGRSPQAIALSIMAQVQQQMTRVKHTRCVKPYFINVSLNVFS